MIVLGINGWTDRGHDGGASLIVDGELKYAYWKMKILLWMM